LALRACVVGAEPVLARTLDAVERSLAPAGLDGSVLRPAYGLAEATLAVTMAAAGIAPRRIRVAPGPLLDGRLELDADPHAVELVSSGEPLDGVGVAIRGEARVGEIVVRSPALAEGYAGAPELTGERFGDGALATGDVGFVSDGELFVVCRADDVIAARGQKFLARQVEQAMDGEGAVRPGGVALVDVRAEDDVRLVALAEVRRPPADARAIARALGRAARRSARVPIDECVLLPPRTLPKTPTGKLRRFECRSLALDPPASAVRVGLPGGGSG
ncbi:MAG TPA: hypothetical protein VJT75_10805, partial [Thermoleophilaceae bacterium]|nr:hypothetical protein [Thermoleophilaceae bacterium]